MQGDDKSPCNQIRKDKGYYEKGIIIYCFVTNML